MWYSIKSYISYLYYSKSIYKIHSPFVYDLVAHVLELHDANALLKKIKIYREELAQTNIKIPFEGYGADTTPKIHSIKRIMNHISLPHRKGKWYFNMINRYAYKHIIELGTCIGIGSLYLAINNLSKLTTFEANKSSIDQAKKAFQKFNLSNISIVEGNIDDTLPNYISKCDLIDMLIIDANHTYDACIAYYTIAKPKLHELSVVIVDDIYWSEEMTRAWEMLEKMMKWLH